MFLANIMNTIKSCFFGMLFTVGTLGSLAQSDSTQRKSKVLGLAVAPVFSLVSFRSEPYSIDSLNLPAPASINKPGLAVSFTFDIPITSKLYLRPAIEAVMLTSKISFETREQLQTTTQVVPMTIDVPIGLYYAPRGFSVKNVDQTNGSYFGIAVRSVFPFKNLLPIKPALNPFIPHADVIAGYHWFSGKSFKRAEVFFSLSLIDYMTHAETDHQWQAVKQYYRHFGGIRMIFN